MASEIDTERQPGASMRSAISNAIVRLLREYTGRGPMKAHTTIRDNVVVVMLEQTLTYRGLYFVLMGRLSPLDGIGPKEIHFDRLIQRATDGLVKEIVLATNFTNEGEATAHYLAQTLKSKGLKVTRLARGVPVGGELEYVDAGTIARAMLDRRSV